MLSPDYSKLSAQMRSDWDRRVAHDYRFWMSDGYQSDEEMWASGRRDFEILMRGLAAHKPQSFLEIGCGVGRLLKPALEVFGRVIGIDVSEQAIQKAGQLLGSSDALSLIAGNGFDLQPLPDEGVDVAVSFAAISSIPTDVAANYLCEINRVLKPGGHARLHMYIGEELAVSWNDTLQLRCYCEDNVKRAVGAAGFELEWLEELCLPVPVSASELGFKAVIVSLKKIKRPEAGAPEISAILLPRGECESAEDTVGQGLEHWMTVNYAGELAEKGDAEQARRALQYAGSLSQQAASDIGDVLQRVLSKIESVEKGRDKDSRPPAQTVQEMQVSSSGSEGIWLKNLELLRERFPEAARQLQQLSFTELSSHGIEMRETKEGPVIYRNHQCLDHPEKPQSAAQVWAGRVCEEEKFKHCSQAVIAGCGSAYHLEELARRMAARKPEASLCVAEPSIEAFAAALRLRDISGWLPRVKSLYLGRGESLPDFAEGSELWIRPQVQALAPDFCSKLRGRFYGQRGLSLLHPTIGVAGPLQGGTLPIMAYVSRALEGLEQRQRVYDVSCFNGGYQHLEKFVKDKERCKAVENTYCEMVSQVILEAVTEKPIDILICMALAPVSPRVLTELKKRGVITVLWFVEDFLRFTYWQEYGRFYDFVFTIQKGKCLESIRQAGAGEVHYLPVGCDPMLHAPVILSREEKERWGSPVSFMGAGYHNRQQIFAALADMPLKIWGTEWPTCRPFDRLVQEGGRRLTPAEYVKIFSASDININLHSSTERDGVDPFGDFLNPRTFELAASGAFQLVDTRSLLPEAFEIGQEIATFSNTRELKEKIVHYLENPEERRHMVQLARARALRDHTYTQRIRQMLSIIYSSKFEHLRRREENGTWHRILQRTQKHDELHKRCQQAFRRGEEPNLDGLISDIVTGQGKLSETEQKLLFLFHVRKQIIRMRREEQGDSK